MIGNRAGVKNPATDGLTFLDKAASLGNPPALTELGKLYIYVAKEKELGLAYTSCASSQGYAPASYELGNYYELVEHNYPKALGYYQVSVSQGGRSAAFFSRASSERGRLLQVQCGIRRMKSLRNSTTPSICKLMPTPIFVFPIWSKITPCHPTRPGLRRSSTRLEAGSVIRLMAIGIWAVLCLAAVPAMADSKPFVCVNEKDHLPLWTRRPMLGIAKRRPWPSPIPCVRGLVSSIYTVRQLSVVTGRLCITWRASIVPVGQAVWRRILRKL